MLYFHKEFVNHLEIIVKKYPNAIFTSDSAFYYFDLTDVIPDYFFLAIKRTDTRINDNSIKQVFVPNELFDFGKTHLQKTISMIVSNVKIACNFCRGLSCPLRHTPMRSTSWGIFFVIKNK